MTAPVTLALTGDQHEHLKKFLFPGDGKEAIALLLCSRREGNRRHRLSVREIHGIPYGECVLRTPTQVVWRPDYVAPLLDRAAQERLSVVKIHSHPTGYPAFSALDDIGDSQLLPMIRGWVEHSVLHGSAVMLPGGEIFGRALCGDGTTMVPIASIGVAGDDLLFWYPNSGTTETPAFLASQSQAFDEGTIQCLRRLSAGVIGCSGSGGPTIEQLARLGIGELVLVEYDHVEDRNINRIPNSTMADVLARRLKVDVLGDAVERIGLGTKVVRVPRNVWSADAVRELGQCDVLFGCMDSIDGRFLLNLLATHYNIPYLDIGVRLDARKDASGQNQIREICGTVNYLRPGRSSLLSRGLITMEEVRAAGLLRNDPAAHAQQVRDGYITGTPGHRPAVISINMFASSLAVNEFLARIHPYREESNASHASVTFSLASMELISECDDGICGLLADKVGLGDTTPLLGQLELGDRCTK